MTQRGLNSRHAYLTRMLPDGRVLDVVPLFFGRARLLLSTTMREMTTENEW